jgi:hypothetical protein
MKAKHIHFQVRALTFMLIAVLVVGCAQNTTDSTAANMMPNLSYYTGIQATDIQDAIAKVAGAASLAALQPQVTALIAGVSSLAKCYQDAGAVQGRAYVNNSDPTLAGFVVIVNRNVLLSPTTLLNCVAPRAPAGLSAPAAAIQPCAKVYTLSKNNNEFYIAYAATNPDLCTAFCSALEGCQ